MSSDLLYVPAPLVAGIIETWATQHGDNWQMALQRNSGISSRTISRITQGQTELAEYNTADALISVGIGRPDLFASLPAMKRDQVIDRLRATIQAREQTIVDLVERNDQVKRQLSAARASNLQLRRTRDKLLQERRELRAQLRHAVRQLASG